MPKDNTDSLSHTRWNCKYHIVFAPKFRRQAVYGKIKTSIGKILRTLCEQKKVEILEAHACPDHIHMLVNIPPNLSVSQFMGVDYLPFFLSETVEEPQKATLVAEKLRGMKLDSVAEFVEKSVEETLSYMSFPREHWTRLRTNNSLERIMKEIRRRTRVVGAFPDGNSALMLVGARLRHITTTKWGTKPYLATCNLYEEDVL